MKAEEVLIAGALRICNTLCGVLCIRTFSLLSKSGKKQTKASALRKYERFSFVLFLFSLLIYGRRLSTYILAPFLDIVTSDI